MPKPEKTVTADFTHAFLDSGVEFAADRLPSRQTVAICFRMLSGLVSEDPDFTGVNAIVTRTLSKGTQRFTGRELADRFDAIGAQWSAASGRQSSLIRVLCLPEFVEEVVELVAEMICRPTFPDDACRVAIELALQDLKHMQDEPNDLLRLLIQRLTLGAVLGRNPGGTEDSLGLINREQIRRHWQNNFHAGRLQVAAAGPMDVDALSAKIEQEFAGFGSAELSGRCDADFEFEPAQECENKELKQEYLAVTLPGLPKEDPRFPIEQVLIGVLSGGMSGRLFTEVREKQGLVYWVGAWHEQPRGKGVIHLGAGTTPENLDLTYNTLLRELHRVSEDLTEEEVARAKNGLIAHAETEDDLTRSRAASLSDDLFHFSRPVGLEAKLRRLRRVTLADVVAYAKELPTDHLCVAAIGPQPLTLT